MKSTAKKGIRLKVDFFFWALNHEPSLQSKAAATRTTSGECLACPEHSLPCMTSFFSSKVWEYFVYGELQVSLARLGRSVPSFNKIAVGREISCGSVRGIIDIWCV